MIAHTTIEVAPPAKTALPGIFLAPFGAEELATVLPINPANAPYERNTTVSYLTTQTPETIADWMATAPHTTTFGIFAEEITPAGFNGIVELAKTPSKEQGLSTYAQRVGMHIYRHGQQNRGIGTAAIQAVMRYGMLRQRTELFVARTSEHNRPMQHVLAKFGFLRGTQTEPIIHYDGSVTALEPWYLATPTGALKANTTEAKRRILNHGFDTFRQLALQYTVQIG